MVHVVIVGGHPPSLVNFRGDLIAEMIAAGHEVTALSAPAGKETIQSLEQMGARFVPFFISRAGLNPLHDMRTFRDLRRIFRQLRPDMVIAYTHKPVIWSGLALRGLKDVRFFPLITGLGFAFQGESLPRKFLTRITEGLYRAALADASGVIFQNPDNRALFEARGLSAGKPSIVVMGSGVNTAHFSPEPFAQGVPSFLMIARLKREKGVIEYLEAARLVKATHPQARFVLAGPGDPSPDGLTEADLRGWSDCVDYAGPVDDVRPLLRECGVYVLPSYSEGLPRTVIEAMSMARPVITTDAPGCRETVRNGENGFLVPVRDVKALAEKMRWMLDNTGKLAEMGAAGRKRAERLFDVRKVNAAMLSFMWLREGG